MYSMCVYSGVMSSGASNDDPPEPATPKIPPPDPNLYTVRAYSSSPQTSGDRITILTVSLCGQVYAKVIICFLYVLFYHGTLFIDVFLSLLLVSILILVIQYSSFVKI